MTETHWTCTTDFFVIGFFFNLWTKLSFCFGGRITLFHCSIPRGRFTSYHHTRENLKRVCLFTLLSPQLSTTLSQKTEVFSFRFLRSSVLQVVYLGQEPLSLDVLQPRVIMHLVGDDLDDQDLLDQYYFLLTEFGFLKISTLIQIISQGKTMERKKNIQVSNKSPFLLLQMDLTSFPVDVRQNQKQV